MRFDMHVHSNVSGDSSARMADVVGAAIDKGLDGLCFTDHCDLMNCEVPGKKEVHCYTNWARSYSEIARVRASFGDRIELLHGMELAEIAQDPERAEQCANAPELDFLLGSVHAVTGYKDFYYLDYPDLHFCRNLVDLYLDENIRLAELNIMDAVAHVSYYNRYMSQHGFWVDVMDYEEKLRHLFEILARNGKGIEINTSGLRRNPGPNRAIPELPVLKLFRECGGEVVTTGSDAHTAKHVGSHLGEAQELLRAAGFGYMTVFRKRKPDFISL